MCVTQAGPVSRTHFFTLLFFAASVQRAQARMLEPLPAAEREKFMRMMRAVIGHHEEVGRSEAAGG